MALKRRSVNKTTSIQYSGGFAGIPRVVLETEDFRGLSSSAKTVLLYLAYQYRGKNNGDLSAPHSRLKEWSIGSKTTLKKALDELQEARMIVLTRSPRFLNPGGRCALYALTWQPINECNGKLEVEPTARPLRKFTQEGSKTPNK